MLKSLYPQVNWDQVKVVGFDLDGTLYDEFDFILQVYQPIAAYLSKLVHESEKIIYQQMLSRWLEKGSTYNKIFYEVLMSENYSFARKKIQVKECINIYRNFTPTLVLDKRVEFLLDYFSAYYPLFVITDGSSALQRAKFYALNLNNWVRNEDFAISGDYGSEFQKPSRYMASKIDILREITPSKVVYFGDRKRDEEFAGNMGFQFAHVKVMKMGESDE